ncbi:hypothetical protein ACXIUA_02630, partial [Corynebacterium sp. UMB8791]
MTVSVALCWSASATQWRTSRSGRELEKAAQARKVRAELKDKLKRGAIDLPEVLKQADENEIIGK